MLQHAPGSALPIRLPHVVRERHGSSPRLRERDPGVLWRTDQERDLKGFNVVAVDEGGLRTQINPVLIACQACGTGSAGDHTFIVPKHRSGHHLYIETVYRDDRVERSGLTRQK
jgi:hypothetical protein